MTVVSSVAVASKTMWAFSAAKLTRASLMPGSFLRARSMTPAQEVQCMPVMVNTTFCFWERGDDRTIGLFDNRIASGRRRDRSDSFCFYNREGSPIHTHGTGERDGACFGRGEFNDVFSGLKRRGDIQGRDDELGGAGKRGCRRYDPAHGYSFLDRERARNISVGCLRHAHDLNPIFRRNRCYRCRFCWGGAVGENIGKGEAVAKVEDPEEEDRQTDGGIESFCQRSFDDRGQAANPQEGGNRPQGKRSHHKSPLFKAACADGEDLHGLGESTGKKKGQGAGEEGGGVAVFALVFANAKSFGKGRRKCKDRLLQARGKAGQFKTKGDEDHTHNDREKRESGVREGKDAPKRPEESTQQDITPDASYVEIQMWTEFLPGRCLGMTFG